MWPFKKKPVAPVETPSTLAFTQVDTTERLDDKQVLGADDWIATVPLNTLVPDGENLGLPGIDATQDQVYSVASKVSEIRESLDIPNAIPHMQAAAALAEFEPILCEVSDAISVE